MTTYQKLKEQNKRLREDLYHVINYPTSQRSLQIKLEWMLKKKMEEQFMAGNPTSLNTN